MNLGVMQPYFFPYIGYFQLIQAVDVFVIYDNVEFVKRGWFHRNRLLFGDKIEYFTINLKNGSDFLNVSEREISEIFMNKDRQKILRKIEQHYAKAPFFNEVFPVIESAFLYNSTNLFSYIYNSIETVCNYLQLDTNLIIASEIDIDHSLKNRFRIFSLSKKLNIQNYINPIGGSSLYSKEDFLSNGVNLSFLQSNLPSYNQVNAKEFVPSLSIIDVMMNNDRNKIKTMLNDYLLI